MTTLTRTLLPAVLLATLAIAASASAGYVDVIKGESSLIGYWRLDETSTTQDADDLSSNENDGTYAGGVTVDQTSAWPALGTAAEFDGSGYMTAGGTEYQMGNNFTLVPQNTIEGTPRGRFG